MQELAARCTREPPTGAPDAAIVQGQSRKPRQAQGRGTADERGHDNGAAAHPNPAGCRAAPKALCTCSGPGPGPSRPRRDRRLTLSRSSLMTSRRRRADRGVPPVGRCGRHGSDSGPRNPSTSRGQDHGGALHAGHWRSALSALPAHHGEGLQCLGVRRRARRRDRLQRVALEQALDRDLHLLAGQRARDGRDLDDLVGHVPR